MFLCKSFTCLFTISQITTITTKQKQNTQKSDAVTCIIHTSKANGRSFSTNISNHLNAFIDYFTIQPSQIPNICLMLLWLICIERKGLWICPICSLPFRMLWLVFLQYEIFRQVFLPSSNLIQTNSWPEPICHWNFCRHHQKGMLLPYWEKDLCLML